MVEYFCGYPKCGKSLIAEERLRRVDGSILYVGTLPNTRPYWPTIWAHQQRRPSTWNLYECSGNPTHDLSYLSQTVMGYKGVLLDGGTFYLNRVLQWGYVPDQSWLMLLRKILAWGKSANVCFLVVDQPVSWMQPNAQVLGRIFHRALYLYSSNLYYVEGGQARQCSTSELHMLDHKKQFL